ncbi:MAG TPA: hypothetical protein VND22_07770 [Actinomycetota bacterium]|nr:hypothetical protein [Actinomycetota bacterium]
MRPLVITTKSLKGNGSPTREPFFFEDKFDGFLLLHLAGLPEDRQNMWGLAPESLRDMIEADFPELEIVTGEPPAWLTQDLMEEMKAWDPVPIFVAALRYRNLMKRLRRRARGTVIAWDDHDAYGSIALDDNPIVILDVHRSLIRESDKQRRTLSLGESVEVDWDPKHNRAENVYRMGTDDCESVTQESSSPKE